MQRFAYAAAPRTQAPAGSRCFFCNGSERIVEGFSSNDCRGTAVKTPPPLPLHRPLSRPVAEPDG
eukprot:scaffold20371_cov102-Isochrysis_galbana.AAC.8